jgi:glycine cleavage system H protein
VRPFNWVAETSSCYLAEDATNWSIKELERFKDFLSISVAKYHPDPSNIVLQDGGELIDHALSGLPDEIWKDFQDHFLNKPTIVGKAESHHIES